MLRSIPHQQARLARRLIDQHYDGSLTLDGVSREVALSAYHLIRVFKRAYRQTPYQYLVQLRIARAKELLRTTDLPITEICAAVGYESLGSFSTLFTKLAGLSPSAYRLSAQPTRQTGYIPLCVCLLHGLDDSANP